MKKAIKLLVLAGALLSVGAMAADNDTETWHFSFPDYIFVYSNVSDVYFDFTTNSPSHNGSSTNIPSSALKPASIDNVLNCINSKINGATLNENSSQASSGTTCTFAPSEIVGEGNFNVTWSDSGSSDGALLIATNQTISDIKVSSGGFQNAQPQPTLKVLDKESSNVTQSDNFETVTSGGVSLGTNQLKYTQFKNIYVVPLSYALEVDLAASSENGDTATVTYTVSVQ